MSKFKSFETLLQNRLVELGARLTEIETELDQPKSADLNDQSIDLEDDEVLEGIGLAGQREITAINIALERIKDGTYDVCMQCGERISEARLNAVPHTVLCRDCASGK